MILVTEALGTVGREVVRFLQGTGIVVRMGTLHPQEARGMEDPDRLVVPFDFHDPESITRALQGTRHLCLVLPTAEDAVEMATLAIDIARLNGVTQIVYISALGADEESGCRLLQQHREIEKYLREIGIGHTILRPNALMEMLIEPAHETILREGQIYLPMGDAKVSYLAARDLGAVSAECMVSTGHQSKIYPLTGPSAIPVEEVAVALGRAVGNAITYVEITDEAARQRMLAEGISSWLVDGLLELYAFYRTGKAQMVTEDVENITNLAPLDIWTWADLHKGEFRAAA